MNSKNKREAKTVQKKSARRNQSASGESMSSSANKMLVALAVIVLIVGVVGYYYFTGIAVGEEKLKNQLIGYGSISVGVVLAILFAFVSQTGRDFIVFFKEARIELRRVFWPSIGETRQMSILVVIVMAVVMVFLMIVDALLSWLIKLIVG